MSPIYFYSGWITTAAWLLSSATMEFGWAEPRVYWGYIEVFLATCILIVLLWHWLEGRAERRAGA